MQPQGRSTTLVKIAAGLIVGLVAAGVITNDVALENINWLFLAVLSLGVLLTVWQMILIWQWPWRRRFVLRWVAVLPVLWIALLIALWLLDAAQFTSLLLLILLFPVVMTAGTWWSARRTRQATHPPEEETPDQIAARLDALLAALEAPHADPQQEAATRYNAGLLLNNLGREAEAIPHFERARDLATERGKHSLAANALNYLGLAQLEHDPAAAVATFQQVHAAFDELIRQRTALQRLFGLNDLRSFDAMALCNLSVAHLKLEQPEAALQAVQAAAEIYAAGGVGGLFAVNLRVQEGRVWHALGRDAEARQRFDQAQADLTALADVSRRDRQTLQTWLDDSRAELSNPA